MKPNRVRKGKECTASFAEIHSLVMAFIGLATLASCSSNEGDSSGQMNQMEAADKVEEHITSAAGSLPAKVELNPVGRMVFPTCELDSPDNPSVIANRSYWLDGIPEEENEEIVESLHDYWSNGNWEIQDDERPENLRVSAENKDDLFLMSVKVSGDGHLSLGASSSCIHPDDEE